VWLPHWAVHLTTFDGCQGAIPARWLLLSEGTRVDISEEKFFKYFWWCWNKLKVNVYICCFIQNHSVLDAYHLQSANKKINFIRIIFVFLLYKLSDLTIFLLFYIKLVDDEVNGLTSRRRLMMIFPCQPISGSWRCSHSRYFLLSR